MLTNQHDPQDTLETFQPVTVGIHVQEMKGFRKELILSLLAPNAFAESGDGGGNGGDDGGKSSGKDKNGKSDGKNGKNNNKNGKTSGKSNETINNKIIKTTNTTKRHSPTLDTKTKKQKLSSVS